MLPSRKAGNAEDGIMVTRERISELCDELESKLEDVKCYEDADFFDELYDDLKRIEGTIGNWV